MSYREPPRTAARRRTRSTILPALIIISATLIGVVVSQGLGSSSSSGASTSPIGSEAAGTSSGHADRQGRPALPDSDEHSGPGRSDAGHGAVPDGATVFEDELVAVTNLDPDLLGALRQAATDAADDGVEFQVNSGWRSPEYQDQLLREAVAEYGSEEEAARWVATADTSPHVSGDAIDIGPAEATAWLSEHGAEYGLCQIYANEPWHYELRLEATDHGCPAMYADPTHDPRMQQ